MTFESTPILSDDRQTPNNTASTILLILLKLLTSKGPTSNPGMVPTVTLQQQKVPLVTAVKVESQTDIFGNLRASLSFEEPKDANISHYNIYAVRNANGNEQPSLVASSARSPVEFVTQFDAAGGAAFIVQTVMRNGYTSDIATSPGTGIQVAPTSVPGAPGSITTTMIADDAITTPKIFANAVTAAKISAGAVTTDKLAAGSVTADKIVAGSISSDKLDSTQISVGGGGGKPGEFRVFNASGVQIGFIGVEGGNEGAWFKTISIGGTSYASGKLKADVSGNLTINDATISITSGSDSWVISAATGIKYTVAGNIIFQSFAGSTDFGTTLSRFRISGQEIIGEESFTTKVSVGHVSGFGTVAARQSTGAAGAEISGAGSGQLSISGTKVVGAQGAAVADASGGATVDSEARTAINTLLARLRAHGLIAT